MDAGGWVVFGPCQVQTSDLGKASDICSRSYGGNTFILASRVKGVRRWNTKMSSPKECKDSAFTTFLLSSQTKAS